MLNKKLETQIQQQEKNIQELQIKLEGIDREITTFLQEFNITAEKLSQFIENQANFTQENWETLQKQRQTLNEKLNLALSNIRNPIKTKRNYSSLHVQRHWIPVR